MNNIPGDKVLIPIMPRVQKMLLFDRIDGISHFSFNNNVSRGLTCHHGDLAVTSGGWHHTIAADSILGESPV